MSLQGLEQGVYNKECVLHIDGLSGYRLRSIDVLLDGKALPYCYRTLSGCACHERVCVDLSECPSGMHTITCRLTDATYR